MLNFHSKQKPELFVFNEQDNICFPNLWTLADFFANIQPLANIQHKLLQTDAVWLTDKQCKITLGNEKY